MVESILQLDRTMLAKTTFFLPDIIIYRDKK